MIIVTGAAGFIGSCMAGRLNNKGFRDLVLVDDFSKDSKHPNFRTKSYVSEVDRKDFPRWFEQHAREVEFVFHLGARTDTTEFNMEILNELNFRYSIDVWNLCTRHRVPLLYASSAATYGDGSHGYDDADPSLPERLSPLNPYGISKNNFDRWVNLQESGPPRWYGMKFFNVFGPNEYHKGRMASVVFHAFGQINRSLEADGNGVVRLFRSHHPDYPDGGQLRDFIYVKDVTEVLFYLMQSDAASGLYNLGTGKARSFRDLAMAVFHAMDLPLRIEFIDTPEDIRDKYQYFTEARMDKLRNAGFTQPFRSLEDAVTEYVQAYLAEEKRC